MATHPTPQEKVEEKDKEIERLSKAVEDEKAATKEVVADLGVKLRHNRMLNSVIRANAAEASQLPPISMPFKGDK